MISKFKYIALIIFFLFENLNAQFAWNQLSLDVTPAPLDLRVGMFGDIQIWRDGSSSGQLYNPNATANGTCGSCWNMYNGLFMTADARTYVSFSWDLDGYYDYLIGSVSAISGSGTTGDPWVISARLQDNSTGTYGFDVNYIYINGTEYIDVELTPFVPLLNTRNIKVYHIMDTYLSASDDGPAYTLGTPPYDVVGVLAADGSVFEAFVATEDPWDRYGSHFYYDLLNEPFYDQNLSNTLDPDPTTDNAIGVQWSLGVVLGTQPTIRYRVGFTADIGNIISCEKSYINKTIGRTVKASGG